MDAKTINISPISKLKRVLVHFGDLFITFIIGFTLVNTAILPIGNKIIKLDEKVEKVKSLQNDRIDILIERKLLFSESSEKAHNFEASFSYTFDMYLSNYVKEENQFEVIKNYFVDVKNQQNEYLELYEKADKDYSFFDIGGTISLKTEYKQLFAPYFSDTDTISKVGGEKLETFRNKIFSNLFNCLLQDIEENDLTASLNDATHSYKTCLNEEKNINNFVEGYFSIGTIIGYLLSTIICFLLVPCFFANRRMIGMIFMRVQSLSKSSLDVHIRPLIAINSIANIPTNMSLIALIPTITVGLASSFALPYLVSLSLVGLLFNIISLFFILFNEYNRSITDIMTGTILISSDDYDQIVYERSVKK